MVLLCKSMEKKSTLRFDTQAKVQKHIQGIIDFGKKEAKQKTLGEFFDDYVEYSETGDNCFSKQDYVNALFSYANASNTLEIYAMACPEEEREEINDNAEYITDRLNLTRNILEDPDYIKKEKLKKGMNNAIKEENYEAAAVLRDKFNALNLPEIKLRYINK